jgi:uncharacterized protein involved in exopolysaccharide biosynthesis
MDSIMPAQRRRGSRSMDSTFANGTTRVDDVALDVRRILRAVLRRWLAVILLTALAGAGTFFALSAMAPEWTAETKILIENREVDLSDGATPGPDRATIDQETVASQVQMLTSRDLARRVAERNRLSDLPEFDSAGGSLVDALLVRLGFGRDPMRTSPEERVIDAFMERLKVYQVDGSRVVVVEFTSHDPELSATIANSVAAEYMALQGEAKRLTSEDQTRWLGDEIERLRGKVRDAEAAVEDYRNQTDLLLGANNTTIARQQISDITNAIAAARSDKVAAEARAAELRSLLGASSDLSGAGDVVDSETFRTLRAREAALRNRESELSVTLLPGHPQMQSLRSQIADIARQQAAEARRVLTSLENDARVAEGRVQTLTSDLERVKATSAANNESEVELRALEREAASQRNLLEGLLVRYSEAIARQNAEVLPADARVISRASVPAEPTFPKVVPMTVVATIAAFLLCIGWIVSAEFVSGRALVKVTGVPAAPRALEDLPAEAVASAAGAGHPSLDDRLETLRTAVAPIVADRGAVLANARIPSADVVGGVPRLHAALVADGRSRVALVSIDGATLLDPMIEDLALAAADHATRVVVVDTVPSNVGLKVPGLSDLVAGDAAFGEVIGRNRITRAHEIGVGTAPLDLDEKAGEVFDTILTALESAYDLVVLSLGEVHAMGTRRRLVAAARHVVLVGDPDDGRVALAYRELRAMGAITVTVIAPPVASAVSEAAA